MTLRTLVIYDINTDDGGDALDNFRSFIIDLGFRKLQNSAYYKMNCDCGDLLDKVENLPHGSVVNITFLDDDQFRKLKINRVT